MRDRQRPSATAYHEAGHAVAAWAFGVPITYASIIPEPARQAAGEVKHGSGLPAHQLTVVRFAGPAAQRRSHPRSAVAAGARWDHALAEMTADVLFDAMSSRRSFLRQAAAEARALVDRHWLAVDRVARALISRRVLSGYALARIVEEADAEWHAATRHDPDLDPVAYARRLAIAGQGPPPLTRQHIANAVLRATLAEASDIPSAILADLTARGFARAAVLDLWTRATTQKELSP